MSQYTIPLLLPADYSVENFMPSPCNEEALQWINSWPNWPAHALLLIGPQGGGKSHLGAIWATRAKATAHTAASLNTNTLPQGNCLIEDIEQLKDEQALFHTLNQAKETGHHLLLTAPAPVPQLSLSLPDLTSRLLALPVATIAEADDAALAAALRKQFADRQIKLDEEVIAYLLPRMERSFAKARLLVERLDQQSLETKRTLTIPFVRQLLDAF